MRQPPGRLCRPRVLLYVQTPPAQAAGLSWASAVLDRRPSRCLSSLLARDVMHVERAVLCGSGVSCLSPYACRVPSPTQAGFRDLDQKLQTKEKAPHFARTAPCCHSSQREMARRVAALVASLALVGLAAGQPPAPTTADFSVYPESAFFCDGNVAVSFNGTQVSCGTEIGQLVARQFPTISWAGATANASYALVLIDRDAPNATTPASSPIRHGAAVNITGPQLIAGVASNSSGNWLQTYSPPQPPFGSGCVRPHISLAELHLIQRMMRLLRRHRGRKTRSHCLICDPVLTACDAHPDAGGACA